MTDRIRLISKAVYPLLLLFFLTSTHSSIVWNHRCGAIQHECNFSTRYLHCRSRNQFHFYSHTTRKPKTKLARSRNYDDFIYRLRFYPPQIFAPYPLILFVLVCCLQYRSMVGVRRLFSFCSMIPAFVCDSIVVRWSRSMTTLLRANWTDPSMMSIYRTTVTEANHSFLLKWNNDISAEEIILSRKRWNRVCDSCPFWWKQ